MKKFIYVVLLLVAISTLALSSCKKSAEEPGATKVPSLEETEVE